MNNNEFQARAEEIDRLVQRVSALENEDARTAALELLQASMDLHGAAMSRVLEILTESGDSGRKLVETLGSDPFICGLLVLYGLHPVTLEDRVARALEKLGSQLRKKEAAVELIGISEDVVRIRITSSGHGCGSSPDQLKSLAQQAILEAAPELAEIVVEDLPVSASGFVPLDMIQTAKPEGREV